MKRRQKPSFFTVKFLKFGNQRHLSKKKIKIFQCKYGIMKRKDLRKRGKDGTITKYKN